MEPYQDAWLARLQDTHALLREGRPIGAMQSGGFAIECLLKGLVVATWATGQTAWPRKNTPGSNPSHNLSGAVALLPSAVQPALMHPAFTAALARVQCPPHQALASILGRGSPAAGPLDYVNLRYYALDPSPAEVGAWKADFAQVHQTLLHQHYMHRSLFPGWP